MQQQQQQQHEQKQLPTAAGKVVNNSFKIESENRLITNAPCRMCFFSKHQLCKHITLAD